MANRLKLDAERTYSLWLPVLHRRMLAELAELTEHTPAGLIRWLIKREHENIIGGNGGEVLLHGLADPAPSVRR